MEGLEKKYNIIIIDEDFIGKVNNLQEYFIATLIYNLKQDFSIEEKQGIISMTESILEELSNYNDNVVVRVNYNPMGSYYVGESLDK